MNKGRSNPAREGERQGGGRGGVENRTCVSAKSKRERPTMGEDTRKEEKAGNRK